MRVLGYLLAALFVLAAIFSGLSAWLLGTAGGARILASQAVQRVPGLSLGELSGNLLEGLAVDELHYEDGALRISVANLFARADLWALLNLEAVHLHELRADAVAARSETPADQPDALLPEESFRLPASPIPIIVDDLRIGALEAEDTAIDDVELRGGWQRDRLVVERLTLESSGVAIVAEGSSTVGAQLELDAAVDWRMADREGTLLARGPLRELRVEHDLRLERERGEVLRVRSVGTVALDALPELVGDLRHEVEEPALSLRSRVRGAGTSWQLGLEGRYERYPFSLSANLVDDGSGWAAEISNAVLDGALRLDGDARLAPDLSGDFAVASIDIARLLPGAEGDFKGRFNFAHDVFRGQLTFAELGYGVTGMRGGQADFTVPLDVAAPIALDVRAGETAIGEVRVGATRIKIAGPLDDFAYTLEWPDTRLAGTVRDIRQSPQIVVEPGSAVVVQDIELSTVDRVEIADSGQGWLVSAHCWRGLGTICVEPATVDDTEDIALQGSFDELMLAPFNPWLPVEFAPAGRLDGAWRWARGAGSWTAELDAKASSLDVVRDAQNIPLPDFQIAATVDAESVAAAIEGAGHGLGLKGRVALDALGSDANVEAELDLEAELGELPRLVAELENLQGRVTGVATLRGPVREPQVELAGRWETGAIAWRSPALVLGEVDAEWRASNAGWQITGSAVPQQGGHVQIEGRGDGYDENATMTARIDGRDIPLKADYWSISAAPRLTVNLANRRVSFDGSVDIPQARVELKSLPQTLPRPSPDVRFIGRAPLEPSEPPVSGNLRVVLGDDVRLKLFVLDIALKGALDAVVVGDDVRSLVGELDISSGTLNASGQTLAVEEGRILFSGDPTNPYVDITALRTIPDQTPPLKVGLRITGLSDDLRTAVYSEPPMAETRALSFLVLGRDFNESSQADSQALIGAAIGFGLKQGQGVVQELRGFLGLDELSALAAEQNDVAIVAGKRVTKDLYVRYSYNALSAIGALVIRYHLTDRWRLEATNEATSSMDLLYEFTK